MSGFAPQMAYDLCWRAIMYVRRRVRPGSCSMATPIVRSAPVRLGTIPYRCVKLSAFLLAGILRLSHTPFACFVRHDSAHPFLAFVLCYGPEYPEGFWRCLLEP